jgi:Icc-related predicted phosphoesterase
MRCVFVSDLHGQPDRFNKLFARLESATPRAVFLGGDLLPGGLGMSRGEPDYEGDFLSGYLAKHLGSLRSRLGSNYPGVFLILGNDDGRVEEPVARDGESAGLWQYIHMRRVTWSGHDVYGYNYIPPSPFQLKDWERYDVSRYVDPGAVSPEEGRRSPGFPEERSRYKTIAADLVELTEDRKLDRAIMLFHTPPYETVLDRADLDDRVIEHVPVDVHVGSIAVRRFIEERQPLLTLHGHVHESTRLTGEWRQQIGSTWCFNAAHDGPELALIWFDPDELGSAKRELL